MHAATLAPGEELLPGTREAAEALLSHTDAVAVLVPLVPQGDHALARAARRYLDRWDGRLLHRQNYFAPATRVVWARAPAPVGDPRNAEAAPALSDALARGGRIEALRGPGLGVACTIADDLSAWAAHWRAEGAAWGALARRDPAYAGFLRTRWWHLHRRVGEVLEAKGRSTPLQVVLHLTREATFGRAAALSQPSRTHATA